MNWYNSIGMKIVLSVVGMILIVNGALAWLFLGIQRENLNHAILRTASQLSETIKKSIRNDMLENRKEAAYKIMETIGGQEGIEKVRVYSSEGKILFSSGNPGEVGRMVNQKAEACYGCHSEARPLDRLETPERSRIFFSEHGETAHGVNHRVLGIINPMYNEAGCSSAACHAHPASLKVLGVIDVTMDLSEVDGQIASARRQVVAVSLISVAAICIIVALILFHFVERPVKELVLGTKRISGGDLDHFIGVTTNDEMGHLAASFNQMTLDLQNARKQIREGIRNLENKVEERTRELTATQSQPLRSEKLAAVGALAATVAHEINNPLTGVYTHIRLMERKIDQGQYGPEEMAKYKRTDREAMESGDFPERVSIAIFQCKNNCPGRRRYRLGAPPSRSSPLPCKSFQPIAVPVPEDVIIEKYERSPLNGTGRILSLRDAVGRLRNRLERMWSFPHSAGGDVLSAP
jgi:two-component system NtrC family sensor kinase